MPAAKRIRKSSPKSGLPKKASTENDEPTPVIFIRCTPEENERFRAAFRQSGLRSYSEWVRQQLWLATRNAS